MLVAGASVRPLEVTGAPYAFHLVVAPACVVASRHSVRPFYVLCAGAEAERQRWLSAIASAAALCEGRMPGEQVRAARPPRCPLQGSAR